VQYKRRHKVAVACPENLGGGVVQRSRNLCPSPQKLEGEVSSLREALASAQAQLLETEATLYQTVST